MAISPFLVTEPADHGARVAALDTARSFIVQAPAGSGKTELLIQRFLALLAEVAEPERVVAITFTRKAAGEMRARIASALREAASGVPVKKAHQQQTRTLAEAVLRRSEERLWNLLANAGRLRIVTIDSLCSSIVQQSPFTSRLGVATAITEDARPLYLQAAHLTVRMLERKDDLSTAVRNALLHLENDVPKLETLLAGMLERRDQWMRHLQHEDLGELRDELEGNLQRIVCAWLKELNDLVPEHLKSQLLTVARFAGDAMFAKKPSSQIAACRELKKFPGCSPEDIAFWTGIASLLLSGNQWRIGIDARIGLQARTPERLLLKDVLLPQLRSVPGLEEKLSGISTLPPCKYEDQQWQMLKTIFQLLPKALENLDAVFARNQAVDFTEVSLAAQRSLRRDSPENAYGHSIEHLLVDEFQDTSVSQVQLLLALTQRWPADGSRTLFLVGDPMQSIYRFRQAEVGLFLQSQREGLGALALEPLRLIANFRSQEGIVTWANETFAQIFPAVDDLATGAVHFEQSKAALPPSREPAVTMHPFFGREFAAREARDVVEIIATSLSKFEKGGKAGRIAVLVRAKDHLRHIVAELHRRDIRFRAVDIDNLGELQVVTDLTALTRAILHLGDRVAWLSILRAPWCGLTLSDLHTLFASELRNAVWQRLAEPWPELSADAIARLTRFHKVMKDALHERGLLPLRELVEKTWIALGGPACLETSTDATNARQFFNLLAEVEAEGDVDLEQLDEAVGRLFAAPDVEADDSVQLMSIHRAKGLEFDVVLLPGLGRPPSHDESRLLLWEERPGSESAELFLAPIKPKAADSDPLYQYLARNEKRRTAEETSRVLYVAATRARTELHLFGHVKKSAQEFLQLDAKPESNSLLKLLWPVVLSDFVRAAEQQGTEAAEIVPAMAASSEPEAEAFHRLISGWKAPAAPASVEWQPGTASRTATVERITYDWVGERTRRVGTVVHAFLQRIVADGLESWTEEKLRAIGAAVRSALRNRGAGTSTLEEDTARAMDAIRFAVTDAKGRWILASHADARSEFALTAVHEGAVYHVQIDRTFVDEQGTRWIIDFKTSAHKGNTAKFADEQVEKYREQLQLYARILQKRDPRPIRVGLYFPLLREWREWSPEVDGNGPPVQQMLRFD